MVLGQHRRMWLEAMRQTEQRVYGFGILKDGYALVGIHLRKQKCCLKKGTTSSVQGYDKVELCDILLVGGKDGSKSKNIFVHVKRKHRRSSGLSHLFQQGNNSLTLLNSGDEKFLKGIEKIKEDFDKSLPVVVYYLIIGDRLNDSIPLLEVVPAPRRKGERKQAPVFAAEKDRRASRRQVWAADITYIRDKQRVCVSVCGNGLALAQGAQLEGVKHNGQQFLR